MHGLPRPFASFGAPGDWPRDSATPQRWHGCVQPTILRGNRGAVLAPPVFCAAPPQVPLALRSLTAPLRGAFPAAPLLWILCGQGPSVQPNPSCKPFCCDRGPMRTVPPIQRTPARWEALGLRCSRARRRALSTQHGLLQWASRIPTRPTAPLGLSLHWRQVSRHQLQDHPLVDVQMSCQSRLLQQLPSPANQQTISASFGEASCTGQWTL